MYEREKIILLISDCLEENKPNPVIIYAAKYLLTEYDRIGLPDWIAALANANTNAWESVVDEVRRLKIAEELE
jgi:hypothetical protein